MNTDPAQMGSLLSKMTAQDLGKMTFTDDQVNNMIEIVIPGIVKAPGMPAGMTCDVERTESGWIIRVERVGK